MKDYWNRIKNPGTILSIVCLIGLIMVQFGVDVDMEWLNTTAKLVCSLCVILGIFNNPTTDGIDYPNLKNQNEIGEMEDERV